MEIIMHNKMVLNIMIVYFVILSIVLAFQLTRLNKGSGAVPSNDDAVLAEDRLNNAVVFYNDSPVILSNKQQMLIDRTNTSYTPVIRNNTAYLPASFFNTVYGANVSLSKRDTSATIRLENKALVISPDESVIVDSSNERELKTQTKPIVYKNTVYIPADVFAEAYRKEVYVYGNMGIIGGSEFTEADNIFLDSLISQVNDLPYVVNETNLRSIANISNTDDIFANIERKIKDFEDTQTAAYVKTLEADSQTILTFDDRYIYFGGTGRVEILSKGENMQRVSNIPTPSSFTAKRLFLHNGRLIVIGNNSQTSSSDIYKGNMASELYIYNVDNISDIKLLRQYSVSGYYQNAVISGEYIYILSKNSVYGLYSDNKFNPPSFSDSSSQSAAIGFDTIQYFPETGSDDITIVSAVNPDTTDVPYVKGFLGAGENTYLSQSSFYVSKSRFTAFDDYESVENNCLYRYTFANGELFSSGKANIKGSLINSSAISEDNGYCRLVTKFTDSDDNNNKVCNVYVLNNNLEICGQANKVANDDDIAEAIFCNKEIYLTPTEAGGNIYSINIENPTLPQGKGALKLSEGSTAMYSYDETTVITLDNGGGVLKLSMYDVADVSSPKQLFSQELGSSESITTSLFQDPTGFIFDKERNIMVIPVKITGNNIFEGAYVYTVNKDEGINRIGTVAAPDLAADCIARGKLVMFSNDKAMVSDINDVQKQTTIEFTNTDN